MVQSPEVKLSPIEHKIAGADPASTVSYGTKGLNWKGVIGFYAMVLRDLFVIEKFYRKALKQGACYYGPFKGEFGHFLLHNLPFLVHLYQKGVKIHYCGMELHKPFLVDEEGNSIIEEWYPIRDFFGEIKPNANENAVPQDVEREIDNFKEIAIQSGLPYLDVSRNNLYWYTFRNWQLNGKQAKFDLSKVYSGSKKNSCVIFPRKKGGKYTPNNGGPWDYNALAKMVSPYFEEVNFVGHPSLSAEVETGGNISLKVSANNKDTLKLCGEAQLIITQHSGAVHLGAYVNTPVLIIFHGHFPVKGLKDTIRFRQNLSGQKLNYAFDMEEIEHFVKSGTFRPY